MACDLPFVGTAVKANCDERACLCRLAGKRALADLPHVERGAVRIHTHTHPRVRGLQLDQVCKGSGHDNKFLYLCQAALFVR